MARSDRTLTETADHPHLKIEAGGAPPPRAPGRFRGRRLPLTSVPSRGPGWGPLASRGRRVSPTSQGEAVPGPELRDRVALGGSGAQLAAPLRVPQPLWAEPVLGEHGEAAGWGAVGA